jgi:hypothetical protein
MPVEATNRRNAGWLFALGAVCYFTILSYIVYWTEPFRFGLMSHPSVVRQFEISSA